MMGQRRPLRNTKQTSIVPSIPTSHSDVAADDFAEQACPSRRTMQASAGTGGRAEQLEILGQTLERPSQTLHPMTTVPQDEPVNPMAPTPARKKRGGGKRNRKEATRLDSELEPLPQPSSPVTGLPVQVPVQGSPNSRFGFQLPPPPCPKYVGSLDTSLATAAPNKSHRQHAANNPSSSPSHSKQRTCRPCVNLTRGYSSLSELSEESEEQDDEIEHEDDQLNFDLYDAPPDADLYEDPPMDDLHEKSDNSDRDFQQGMFFNGILYS
ncbi:hypothetical protein EV363DRAFT_1168712 [Boletus edulis]|nr:hypothetical protein EV363DRAFT_1168712 [Boletus edulis]